jgi:hypothetical protein
MSTPTSPPFYINFVKLPLIDRHSAFREFEYFEYLSLFLDHNRGPALLNVLINRDTFKGSILPRSHFVN